MSYRAIAAAFVVFGVLAGAGVVIGGPPEGPSAEVSVEPDSDYETCSLDARVKPGDADRIVVDTGVGSETFDVRTTYGATTERGATVEVYAVSFGDGISNGEVEVLATGFVTEDCSLEELEEPRTEGSA
jgi:hypothetical protein